MIMKTKKPTDLDVSLKYICDCGLSHWLFLREAQSKNFKIVCECGEEFSPVVISKIDILYNEGMVKNCKKPPSESVIKSCISLLLKYGYSNEEASTAVSEAVNSLDSDNVSEILKCAMSNLGN